MTAVNAGLIHEESEPGVMVGVGRVGVGIIRVR